MDRSIRIDEPIALQYVPLLLEELGDEAGARNELVPGEVSVLPEPTPLVLRGRGKIVPRFRCGVLPREEDADELLVVTYCIGSA